MECVLSIHLQLSPFETRRKRFPPRSLEQSWEMKPCPAFIVTEESSLISQRYYPQPCLPSLPLPLFHPSPSYIVPQDQVHRGRGWSRVMGPLSLCLRAGWMGCGPCPHTGSQKSPPSLLLWSPVSSDMPSFLTVHIHISKYLYSMLDMWIHPCSHNTPPKPHLPHPQLCTCMSWMSLGNSCVVWRVFISKQFLTNQNKYQEKPKTIQEFFSTTCGSC